MTPPSPPLLHWPDPLLELVGFVGSFLGVGAVGFRLGVLARVGPAQAADALDPGLRARAARRAAGLGLAGALVSAALLLAQLPEAAARHHATVGRYLAVTPVAGLQAALLAAALVGLALAAATGARAGWALAALGVVAGPLAGAFSGQWARLVNPVHRLAAGLWIGTLFVMVTAGLGSVLRSGLPSERRGAVAAELVHAFSPLALGAASVLALFGVITAWRHLHRWSSLWTTPYGVALIAKLALVAGVLALGAWNWRRQRPRLGSEAGARGLRRSAALELTVAGAVLVVTAILVSLPSPRP